MSTISRRDFMKTAGVMTLAVAASAALAGCSTENSSSSSVAPVITPTASNKFDVTLGHNTLSLEAKAYGAYDEVTGAKTPIYATFTFASKSSSLTADGSIVKHVEIRDNANKVIYSWAKASSAATVKATRVKIKADGETVKWVHVYTTYDEYGHELVSEKHFNDVPNAADLKYAYNDNETLSLEQFVTSLSISKDTNFWTYQEPANMKAGQTLYLYDTKAKALKAGAGSVSTGVVETLNAAWSAGIASKNVKTSTGNLSFIAGNGGFTYAGATDVLIKYLEEDEILSYTVYINYGDDNATVSYPVTISDVKYVTL